MNVYIMARGYPTKKYPMNGVFEFDQAKALAEYGHKVTYLAVDLRSLRRKRHLGRETLIKDGVTIECINIPCGKLPKKFLRGIRFLALKYLYKECIVKYGKADIIHSHFLEISYTVGNVLKKEETPLIMTEHLSTLNNKQLSNSIIKTGEKTYNKFKKVIVVGENLKQSLLNNFNIESLVIPNIVDLSTFNYNIENKQQTKGFRVVSVGSLNKRKDMNLLIEAFKELVNEHKECQLIIYGKGPEKKALEIKINELNLKDNVKLMGLRPRNEISSSMEKANCFALASHVETFGVAYIEAMAMGLPVIATESGGPENFVNNDVGVLVQPKDKQEIVQALFYMYDNYNRFNKRYISEYVKERFSSKIIGQKITELYEDILK